MLIKSAKFIIQLYAVNETQITHLASICYDGLSITWRTTDLRCEWVNTVARWKIIRLNIKICDRLDNTNAFLFFYKEWATCRTLQVAFSLVTIDSRWHVLYSLKIIRVCQRVLVSRKKRRILIVADQDLPSIFTSRYDSTDT